MYQLDDTIAAISSGPGRGTKSIIRLSGTGAFAIVRALTANRLGEIGGRGIIEVPLCIDDELQVDGQLYIFSHPDSYTGDDLVEIHLFAGPAVAEAVLKKLYELEARAAGAGEFTARAYLNGKIDLAQAEAVAEVVSGSNKFQLAAAGRLLAGKLGETVNQIRERMLEVITLLEAGIDFSTEDIEFISCGEAIARIERIRASLEALAAQGIYDEVMIGMPSVGIAGQANAGKSSLANALLGYDRSIVSHQEATTRDVLTGICELENTTCVLFDCAGLMDEPAGILDELVQSAARQALASASAVIFCVDVTRDDYRPAIALCEGIDSRHIITVATKCDLLNEAQLTERMGRLRFLVGADLIATSAKTKQGLNLLRKAVDNTLVRLRRDSSEAAETITITQRHKQLLKQAIDSLTEAICELGKGSDEVASMLLRTSSEELAGIKRQSIDDAVLERIFSRFCIGK